MPDIVVTLAMSFVWGGVALLIMRTPGGGAPIDFQALGTGTFVSDWVPAGAVVIALVLLRRLDADPLASPRLRDLRDRLQPRRGRTCPA